jgi:hypothetical protein
VKGGSGVSEKFSFRSERRGFCDEMLAAAMTSDAKSQIGPAKRDALHGRWSVFVVRMARPFSFFAWEDGLPGTLQVCSFFAGMNGISLPSEALFSHVPFFSGAGKSNQQSIRSAS